MNDRIIHLGLDDQNNLVELDMSHRPIREEMYSFLMISDRTAIGLCLLIFALWCAATWSLSHAN